jgi:poly-D-alanine transfer protein DltD
MGKKRMTDEQKKIGRPLKVAEPGTRISLGLKVTAEIKQKLDEAAKQSGRTQSQEAEFRLNRDFWSEAQKGDIENSRMEEAIERAVKRAIEAAGIKSARKSAA